MNNPAEQIFHGIATSEGIVIGTAYVFHFLVSDDGDEYPSYSITDDQVSHEIERFDAALALTRQQIQEIQQEYVNKAGAKSAKIFDAHLLLLEDQVLIDTVHTCVREQKQNIEAAFAEVTNTFLHSFSQVPDSYMGERASDIRDVARRIMHNLIGTDRPSLSELEQDVIVIAHDLSPSDTATMHKERVVGIVTEVGGPTSHTSIMSRALEVPAVSGATAITSHVNDDDPIIVDGMKGIIILNPTEAHIEKYRQQQEIFLARKTRLSFLRNQPAITTDDRQIKLLANIEIPEEINHVLDRGAEGVGLYRTEYLFMNRQDLPSEEEQYEAYSYVAERCGERTLVIRTLDLGGDKFASSLTLPKEMNPFMGWRAIRLCLERTDIFKVQLRAILRASSLGNVRVMFPMISTVQEVRLARQLIEEVKTELLEDGYDLNPDMLVGAMIEIPSAALIADVLARDVDFFSIGTNDLIQYTLAIDRVNEKTAQMYDPMNLAVLRLMKIIIDAAHCTPCPNSAGQDQNPACPIGNRKERKVIPVSVCGEMASMPSMALLLVGLGVDELSTVATSIPANKELIRALSYKSARTVAAQALQYDDPEDVRTLVREHMATLKLT